MSDYIRNVFSNILVEDEHKIIPLNWMPTNFYKITFEGWNCFTFDVDDETLSIIVEMASKTFHSFVNIYKKTHAFTEPEFCIKQDGTFYIDVGTMEIEEYNQRINREENER